MKQSLRFLALMLGATTLFTPRLVSADNPCAPGFVLGQGGDGAWDDCSELPNMGCCDGNTKIWCNFATNVVCAQTCISEEPDCGDSICSADENPTSCPNDCTSGCGNGNCGLFENTQNCPKDCGESCGDGVCNGSENPDLCPEDCFEASPYCGWDTENLNLSCLQSPSEQSPIGSVNCQSLGSGLCGEPGFSGCCDNGHILKTCDDSQTVTIDCEANDDPTKNQCGWIKSEAEYGCTELGLAEATGVAPFLCPSSPGCSFDCVGKACGSDGCGGICGECMEGTHCEGTTCVCTPQCAGLQCGPDSCEGSCGDCPEDLACNTATGQCQDCVADCSDRECGSDGCDGSCGDCLSGQVCNFETGTCEGNCADLCDVKECGDDGCGGSCGECGPGRTCILAGICVSIECITECEGLECGINTCGDPCGICAAGTNCSASGFCVDGNCIPSCSNSVCGPDGCGGLCGQCADLEICVAGLCVPQGSSGPDSGGGFGDTSTGSGGCSSQQPAGVFACLILLVGLLSLRRRARP